MAWTEDRVEILTKLWADGLSASQIAKQLGGVTRNAVIGKVHRLGLSGRAKPSRPATRRAAKPAAPRATAAAAATAKPRVRAKPKTPSIPKIRSATLDTPLPAPVEAKPLPNGEFATILTIRDHMCKWPIGDPGDDDFRFCGRKVKESEPYCAAYQPSRRRGEGPKALPMRPRNKYLPRA
jgi:GcrA cell cycle regulator